MIFIGSGLAVNLNPNPDYSPNPARSESCSHEQAQVFVAQIVLSGQMEIGQTALVHVDTPHKPLMRKDHFLDTPLL